MIEQSHIPKLTLVGAGPGDPDLITVKAIKALADADVILYDALANEELLNYVQKRSWWANEQASTIYNNMRSIGLLKNMPKVMVMLLGSRVEILSFLEGALKK